MLINYLAVTDIPSRHANALQIVQMCNGFIKNKHKVNLIIPNFKGLNYSLKSYYDVSSRINIIKIGKNKGNLSKLENIIIPIKLVFRSFFIKSDLTITRNLVISLIFVLLGVKHILEIHDDIKISGNLLAKIFRIFKILNSSSIVRVIFITNSLKNYISKKYFYKKKNFKILSDATSIVKKKIFSISKNNYKIGYFGSIYKSRGIETIFKLAKIDKKNYYYIYGGLFEDVKILRNKFKLKNLIFKSQITYKKVKKEIFKMDVLLMPYTDKATSAGDVSNIIKFMSPMKMFDYLGSGKVIISSDIKVLREILINNYNSILIKNYLDINSWKKQIDKVNLKSKKYIRIKKNAIKTASKHTWEERASQMLAKI